jgi:photosystem II stability/assembly factor-like uncharacterized protein
MMIRNVVVVGVLCAAPLRAQEPVLTVQQSGTTALLQAVSVSRTRPDVVWISGHAGTWARTTDGGRTWQSRVVPGRDSLQFRDLHAIDGTRAWLMAAGTGDKSGIFRTVDGGATWSHDFVNRDTAAFYDCMAFWNDSTGFAFSDAVAAQLPLARTGNGREWAVSAVPGQQGEGGFAASGTCALAAESGLAWIATGAGAVPRVMRSRDFGRSWQASTVPLVGGSGAGSTGIAFRDAMTGVVVGGAISGAATGPRAARTADGGATWSVTAEPTFAGAAYGVAYGSAAGVPVLIAVGPGGASWSGDDGASWRPLDAAPYWSVGCAVSGPCWMAGPKGRIVRVDWQPAR